MKRASFRSLMGMFAVGTVATTVALGALAGPKDGKDKDGKAAAAAAEGDAPQVSTLVPMMDGFKWGQSPQDVINAHIGINGVIDKDFDPLLARVQPGVQQKALESERDNRKAAFQRSLIEFKDTPTGYDATALKTEYSYKNRESLLMVERAGKKRFFFFIGAPARLWKIYDEIPLDETGPLGKSYQDAITKLQGALAVAGRVRAADPAQGLITTTVDWQDATSHLRALDRKRIVAVVLEERQTLANLERLRMTKAEDPLAMDQSILAVTKGGISDPSKAAASASASGSARRGGPPKKP
jgi:hypothetical protein